MTDSDVSLKSEKKQIRKKFPSGWRELEEVLDNAKIKRKSKSRKEEDSAVYASVPNYSCNGDEPGLDESHQSRKSRTSLTEKMRRLRSGHFS